MIKKILSILIILVLVNIVPTMAGHNEKTSMFMCDNNSTVIEYKNNLCKTYDNSILWDNGIEYTSGSIASHFDENENYDPIGADDFIFESDTTVTGVNWIGAYAPGADGDFDWKIIFYRDRGDGEAPGDKFFETTIPNSKLNETLIEKRSSGWWAFSYSVYLEDSVMFTAGEKYWLSVQGVGIPEPWSYWACKFPVVLHDLVWKCPYDNIFNWKSSTQLWYGNRLDFCFQLTGEGGSLETDLECEGDLIWDYKLQPGTVVNNTFLVYNTGDIGSVLKWEILSYPNWGTNWSAKWMYKDLLLMTDGGYVGTTDPEEIILEFQVPDVKNQDFSGSIILANSHNMLDTYTLNVVCKTVKSKVLGQCELFNPYILERFPFFHNIFLLNSNFDNFFEVSN